MKRVLLFLLFQLFCYFWSFAQVMGNYAEQQQLNQNIPYRAQFRAIPKTATILSNNQVEISINALSNQKATTYTAVFNLIQAGKTAEETNGLLNSRLDGFINELKALGIAREDIYVDMVNFLPKYEYDVSKKLFSKKTFTEIPKGFELQKNVHIRYSDPVLLDKIVSAAAHQEIYDIIKVDYFVRDPQKRYAELREAAFQYLGNIKSQYKMIGVNLDSAYVVTAENAWVAYPLNRYESYQAYSAEKLGNDEKYNAIINNADKPSTRFYNAVPANDYDVVINPEILEPAVQFSYNLLVRYTLPERKPSPAIVPKKEYLLITPNGDLKSIKMD